MYFIKILWNQFILFYSWENLPLRFLKLAVIILVYYSSVNLLGTRLLGTNGIFEKNLLWTF